MAGGFEAESGVGASDEDGFAGELVSGVGVGIPAGGEDGPDEVEADLGGRHCGIDGELVR